MEQHIKQLWRLKKRNFKTNLMQLRSKVKQKPMLEQEVPKQLEKRESWPINKSSSRKKFSKFKEKNSLLSKSKR